MAEDSVRPDVAAGVAKLTGGSPHAPALAYLQKRLREDEQVVALAQGVLKFFGYKEFPLFAATTLRVLVITQQPRQKGFVIEESPLSLIQGAGMVAKDQYSLGKTVVRVQSQGGYMDVRGIVPTDAGRFISAVNALLLAPAPNSDTAAAPQPDRITQLAQLGELRQKGVLTEAEFAAEKARLLA